ncbi:DNA mismatch repair endonuclease MutH [Opacimonas viscosa]|uniref:DNA mismatch repair protein MutH n=1 Tax=Opacimonas viscosa TaxID=2961944 RepID=A0AA41X2J5_9ALTE|nr:DNA mismatch repair endonuclease MutH [Opacimonas viscosa]MCP3428323.1 DNA mismatch repair endonuclease MutH [Opacimonas viscosa]
MRPPHSPPQHATDLIQRAEAIAGLTLGDLGAMANIVVPENFKRHKGFTGQLLELWLGASAGSKPQQDFPELGIELKTIPIDSSGKVLETTYVCFAHTQIKLGTTWENSSVRNKLSQVLFIPVLGDRAIPPVDRMIGMPVLWQPNEQENAVLKQDWEELTERISLGQIDTITATMGQALHIRPKAADGSALTDAIGSEGETIQTRPRGFYLRKTFTQNIIR